MALSSCISSSSICSRPAVSIKQHIAKLFLRLLREPAGKSPPAKFPGWSRTPANQARCRGSLTARWRPAGRYPRAPDTGVRFLSFFKIARELGQGGGFTRALQADQHDDDRRRRLEIELADTRRRAARPVSSRTTLINCCSGVRLWRTSWPIDLALTASRKLRTTLTWTSASKSASARRAARHRYCSR